MLTIKAYSKESFKNFHNKMKEVGVSNGSKDYIIFDEIQVNEIRIIFYKNLTIVFNKKINEKIEKEINILVDKNLYIGVDEVGVGESLGPLVVCAARFKNVEDKFKALLLGVRDSKKLSHEKIKTIALQLLKIVEYKLITIEPEKLNKLWLEIGNIKKINALSQIKLINSIYEENYIPVIDAFVNEKKFFEYVEKEDIEKYKEHMIFKTKAEDKYLEVACASIIAKYRYNDWVINYFNDLNIKINIKKNKKLNVKAIYDEIKNGNIIIDENKILKEWAKSK